MVFDTVFSFEELARTLYDLPSIVEPTPSGRTNNGQAATKSIAAPFMQ